MLNATLATSLAGAQRYYTTLSQGDYYLLGREVVAMWRGQAAAMLGFAPGTRVTKAAFEAALAGSHPITGDKLVQRLRKDRRPGTDLTFSCPKSVSLAWAINGDERIIAALQAAVHETMALDVEPLVCRRVRAGKQVASTDRKRTGNLLYADFLHLTSRPVDGLVDCHLHVHAFVPNVTFDNGVCYAAELEEVMRQLPALQAKFEARLARRLEQELGYEVVAVQFRQSRRVKTGWELAGIDRSTIEKFSTRTTQIEAYAEAHDVVDPEAKGRLGAKTRQKKESGVAIEWLRSEWQARLSPGERASFGALQQRAIGRREVAMEEGVRAAAAVRFALDHHLYRSSTVERHVVIGTAVAQGLTLAPEAIEAALTTAEGTILCAQEVRGERREYVTTHAILAAERQMIAYVRDGRGTRRPLASTEHRFQRDWLNDQQKAAVRHVLTSKDAVLGITGGAGTGKTSLMEEAVAAIEANGKPVFVFAPSTGAREVLQAKGFPAAETVEHLLRNETLHPRLHGGVLWIDEAGLLDVRAMNGIFAIAAAHDCRVVLSGDSRQHGPVRTGESLRLLEREAGLSVARVELIQRQRGQYKQAIELVSRGHEVVDPQTGQTGLAAGMELLDRLGKIRELQGADRHAALADAYLQATAAGKSTLVIAPTHAEGEAVTREIRDRLRAAGAIGTEETSFLQLRSLNLSEAQKGQAASYAANSEAAGGADSGRSSADLILQFHQNAPGFVRGERYRVHHNEAGLPYLLPAADPKRNSVPKPIPFDAADRFEVYAAEAVRFAPGDRIRFTLGGKSQGGQQRISNGRLDVVKKIDRHGALVLESGLVIAPQYGHLDLGFVVTSQAAQGKDCDVALVAIGRESLPAVNLRQIYVSSSRGREDLVVFVDDKEAVFRAIQSAGEQLSATELVSAPTRAAEPAQRMQVARQRAFIDRVRDWWRTHVAHPALGPALGSAQRARTATPYGPTPSLSRS